jgi:hypothetical protein
MKYVAKAILFPFMALAWVGMMVAAFACVGVIWVLTMGLE